MKITKDKWVWMPHAGHFICSDKCQFHLNTRVGKYIISTVGEYLSDSQVREILAGCREIELEGKGDAREYDWKKKAGWEELGSGRTYETMVFKNKKSKHKCCPWEIKSGAEIDMDGYKDADSAYKGHLKLCNKYSNQ